MTFELPALPYSKDALAPFLSPATVAVHYGKHHAGYLNRLNQLVRGTDRELRSLATLVRETDPERSDADRAVFEQAAQAWNHTFYWSSISPDGGGEPTGDVRAALEAGFGSVGGFVEEFGRRAKSHFGSGWCWLVQDADGRSSVRTTQNADTPLRRDERPLLCLDLWEHAYYLDYKNERARYVDAFWDFANWDFAARNLAAL